MKIRIAAFSAVLALTAAAGTLSTGSASATVSGGGCGSVIGWDNITLQSCVTYVGDTSGRTIVGSAYTNGTNNTTIDLCSKIQTIDGVDILNTQRCTRGTAIGLRDTSGQVTLGKGQYRAVAFFKTPSVSPPAVSATITIS
ncbi:hypothetical protein [Catenulispora subtropica]|uniref:Secreted protein n=1 Tax=Catenulispora subtropica TaxID=450798 RepID=A0ABN2T5Y7_9ACTN